MAAVLGLLAVGLVMLAIAFAQRRSDASPVRRGADREPSVVP